MIRMSILANNKKKSAGWLQPNSKALNCRVFGYSAGVGDISTAYHAGTGPGSASQIGRRSAVVITFLISHRSNSHPVVFGLTEGLVITLARSHVDAGKIHRLHYF